MKLDLNPTDAQKQAGNYRKHHISYMGLPISIENASGSERSGVSKNGHHWHCTLPYDYGYIKGTKGADDDHVDVCIGPHRTSDRVFVIDQQDSKTKKFDEHKVMIGYDNKDQAVGAYKSTMGQMRIGGVTELSMDKFKVWLKDHDTTKPMGNRSLVGMALGVLK